MSRPPQDIDARRRALGVSRYGVVTKVLALKTTEDNPEMQDAAETPLPVR